MKAQVVALLLVVIVLSATVSALGAYQYQKVIDTGGAISFTVYWNLTSTRLYVGMRAATTGWIGIGFSPGIDMVGADIAVGWVSGSTNHLVDYYGGNNNGLPDRDTSQDLTLISAGESGGVTTVEFSRNLNTADAATDLVLNPFVQLNLIWAADTADPSTATLGNSNKHSWAGADIIQLCYDCTSPSTPTAPVKLSANATSITLQWTAPAIAGGAALVPVTGYTLQVNDGLGGSVYSTACTGNILSCAVSSLVAGRSYQFRVSATNAMGTSGFSAVTVASTASSVPGRPPPPFLSASSNSSLTIAWMAPSDNGGSNITSYTLYKNSSAVYTGTALTKLITSLTANTKYGFAVVASNTNGPSASSDYAYFSTDRTGGTAPGAPTNVSMTTRTTTSLTFQWSDPADNGGAAIAQYQLQITRVGYNVSTQQISKTAAGSTATYTFTLLIPATDYDVRVAAINSNGMGPYSSIVRATTATPVPVPSRMLAPSISQIGEKSVRISWSTPASDSPILGYNLTRTVFNLTSVTSFIDLSSNNATTFVDSGLVSNTKYGYAITAISTAGQSLLSDQTNVTTLSALVAGPVNTALYSKTVTLGDLQLSWNVLNPSDANPTWEVAASLTGTGWIGIGISPTATMAGADMVIGYVQNGVAYVSDYYATDHTKPRLDTSAANAANDILSYAGSEDGGTTVIVFRRPFIGSDTAAGLDRIIQSGGAETTIIYAYHRSSDSLIEHQRYGSFRVDLTSSSAQITTLSSEIETWKALHGLLMVSAWLVAAPIAILIARHFKSLGHRWYTLHWTLLTFAVLATLLSFIIVLANKLPEGQFLVDNPLHGIVGLFIVLATVIQPILGKLADKYWNPNRLSVPVFPDRLHWWMGRTAVLLAMANCLLGVVLIEAGTGWLVAAILVVCSAVVVAVYLHVTRYPSEHHAPVTGGKSVEKMKSSSA